MNHMSVGGNVHQYMKTDYGEFIQIGEMRFRKDLIISYCIADKFTEDPKGRENGMIIVMSARSFGVPVESREDAELTLKRLDWIFKKDSIQEKEDVQRLEIKE